MFKILNQPYPLPEKSFLRHLFTGLLEGVGVALFFILFQPFGISEWQHPHKNLILGSYGVIVTLCTTTCNVLLPKLFPNIFVESKWVIWKEILSILFLLCLITIANIIYSKLIFPQQFSSTIGAAFWMFINVALIGSIPISFGVMSNYIYQLKKYNQTIVIQHPEKTDNQEVEKENKPIKLIAENEKDSIEFNQNQLFYIESSDNYSTVFYERNGKLQKDLLRSSLTRLENQINSSNIVRCHRSFIVNLDKVKKVTGNAQGYKLHLETPELFVPVARKYSEVVEKLK